MTDRDPLATHPRAAQARLIASQRRRGRAFGTTLPPDVARAVQGAARAYERLAAEGCDIRFKTNALTRRAVVQLHNCDGNEARSIDPSELFRLLSEGD